MQNSLSLRKVAFIGFCFMFFPFYLDAQVLGIKDFKERRVIADSIIGELKDGVVVIRLKSYRNNLTAMDKSLANKQLSKKERKRIQKSRDAMVRDRDRFNNELVTAFHEMYDFSDFLVMYDTSSHLLLSGIEKGYFLNQNLEPDPSIHKADDRPFVILGEGTRNKEGIHGLVVYNAEGDIIQAPFPSFFDFRNHKRGLLSLFRGDAYVRKSGESLVQNIITRFNRFYRDEAGRY